MFELLYRQSGLLALLAALARCVSLMRSIDRLPLSPSEKKALLKALLAWNLPWAVMGLGIVIRQVPDLWDYFQPRHGNPYVLACFALQVLVLLAGLYWVLLRDGADAVASYCEASTGRRASSAQIKISWGLGTCGALGALALMCLA